MIWKDNYTYEECNFEGKGYVIVYQCSKCGAGADFYKPETQE